jgi:hypothetical protein
MYRCIAQKDKENSSSVLRVSENACLPTMSLFHIVIMIMKGKAAKDLRIPHLFSAW